MKNDCTNVAAVFGDVFPLLDHGDDEVSKYPIQDLGELIAHRGLFMEIIAKKMFCILLAYCD